MSSKERIWQGERTQTAVARGVFALGSLGLGAGLWLGFNAVAEEAGSLASLPEVSQSPSLKFSASRN